MKLDLYFISYTKVNSKIGWRLQRKVWNYKLLAENMGGSFMTLILQQKQN